MGQGGQWLCTDEARARAAPSSPRHCRPGSWPQREEGGPGRGKAQRDGGLDFDESKGGRGVGGMARPTRPRPNAAGRGAPPLRG